MTPAVVAACSPERLRAWNRAERDLDGTCVTYWMSHAQRAVHDLAASAMTPGQLTLG